MNSQARHASPLIRGGQLVARMMGLAALSLVGLISFASTAEAQLSCFPTCGEEDGKFLVVSGGDPQTEGDTFANFEITLQLIPPNPGTPLNLLIFDGDISGNGGHWDQGGGNPALFNVYSLYSDTNGDGQPDALLATVDSNAMPDNDWFSFPAPAQPHAAYVLVVSNPTASQFSWNAFKVAVGGMLRIAPQSFAFIGSLNNLNDAPIIYPAWPALSPTTYDGTWEFRFEVASPQTTLTIWDGDLDFGRWNCTTRDTDDPDTPNGPPNLVVPFPPGGGAVAEGAAIAPLNQFDCSGNMVGAGGDGSDKPSGNPPDDSADPIYRREPDVRYVLIDPNGVQFENLNPSGNREWEAFTISSDPAVQADHHVAAPLPAGVYTIRMTGMDLGNLNYWHIPFTLLPPEVCEPCEGKVSELTLRYLGTTAAQITVVGRRGPSTDTLFSGTVQPNGTFTIVGPNTGNPGFAGTVGTEIRISIDGAHNATIHTSCSQPIGPGLVRGSFEVVSGRSKIGGLLCPLVTPPPPPPPPPPSQCGCEGKVSQLTLRYNGTVAAQVSVTGKRGPSQDPLFNGTIQPGQTFSIAGPNTGNPGFAGTLGTDIQISINGQQHTTIHTSCSQPIGPGLVRGSFEVVSGSSKNAGVLCPVAPDAQDGGDKDDDGKGKGKDKDKGKDKGKGKGKGK